MISTTHIAFILQVHRNVFMRQAVYEAHFLYTGKPGHIGTEKFLIKSAYGPEVEATLQTLRDLKKHAASIDDPKKIVSMAEHAFSALQAAWKGGKLEASVKEGAMKKTPSRATAAMPKKLEVLQGNKKLGAWK